MKYDYLKNMTEDVKEYIKENYEGVEEDLNEGYRVGCINPDIFNNCNNRAIL